MARKMKDSGIEWIGDIPEGWRTINPKALFTQRKDKAQKGERQLQCTKPCCILFIQRNYCRRFFTNYELDAGTMG